MQRDQSQEPKKRADYRVIEGAGVGGSTAPPPWGGHAVVADRLEAPICRPAFFSCPLYRPESERILEQSW